MHSRKMSKNSRLKNDDSEDHEQHIEEDIDNNQREVLDESSYQLESDDNEEVTTSSIDDSMNEYIYDGCEITFQSACLLIKSFAYRHQLSGQAQADLLRLFQMMLPKPNNLPPSLYLFRKGENTTEEIVHHYYCT